MRRRGGGTTKSKRTAPSLADKLTEAANTLVSTAMWAVNTPPKSTPSHTNCIGIVAFTPSVEFPALFSCAASTATCAKANPQLHTPSVSLLTSQARVAWYSGVPPAPTIPAGVCVCVWGGGVR
jgi:hypothetical protein